MNVVGLGQAGCNIAEKFKQYPQYEVYKIDVSLTGDRCFAMPYFNNHEQYEQKCPEKKLKDFLKEVNSETLFITSAGTISGSTLRIIKLLKDNNCKVSILYIKPDKGSLNNDRKLQENLLFGVLQEYARSSALEQIYLISNESASRVIGNVPVKQYYDSLNAAVASTYHMINIFSHSESAMSTFSSVPQTARILTFGIVNYENSEEKMFFLLDKVRNKRYYYAIPETILDKDSKLLNNIKEQVKGKLEHEQMSVGYAIYPTQYDEKYVYCLARASMIQKNIE